MFHIIWRVVECHVVAVIIGVLIEGSDNCAQSAKISTTPILC